MKSKNESETLEYKQSLSEKLEAGKTLSAFANKQGGTLYFGSTNTGESVGMSNITEKTVRDISQYFMENIKPRIYPVIEERLLLKILVVFQKELRQKILLMNPNRGIN